MITEKFDILNAAKSIANTKREETEKQKIEELTEHQRRLSLLNEMKSLVINELRKLDKTPNKFGIFDVQFIEGFDCYDIIAYVSCKKEETYNNKTMINMKKVAWFKAKIVSGTYDMSDDCRDVPYIEPRITARFYPPYLNDNHNGYWDQNEERWYHNGGWTISVSKLEEINKFFKEMANLLSDWL